MLPAKLILGAGLFELTVCTLKDQEIFLTIYCDDVLMKYISPNTDHSHVLQVFQQLVLPSVSNKVKVYTYMISCKQQTIGIVGLKLVNHLQTGEQTFEFGVILMQNWQGKGLSLVIKQHLLAYLFDVQNIQQALAYCHVDNSAANHVNKKIGMQLMATEHQVKKQRKVNKWSISTQQFNKIS